MKITIVKDIGRTHPYVHKTDDFASGWPPEVVAASKRYQMGTDAIKKIDLFTLFKIIGSQDLSSSDRDYKRYALLNTRKKILIFAPQSAVKVFCWKEAYIRFIFRNY